MQRFMVVERFHPGQTVAVYERFAAQGRLLPKGLHFIASWPSKTHGYCFQLMETDDPALFDIWFARWADLVTFELYPVD